MKSIFLLALSICFVGSLAVAQDAENKSDSTVEHSHNPLTGSNTTTETATKKTKDPSGAVRRTKMRKKTKVYKDGSTDVKVEGEASHSN